MVISTFAGFGIKDGKKPAILIESLRDFQILMLFLKVKFDQNLANSKNLISFRNSPINIIIKIPSEHHFVLKILQKEQNIRGL